MRLLLITALSLVATDTSRVATNAPATVEIKTFQFAPDTLLVRIGTRVRWINRDEIEHTVTTGSPDKREPLINKLLAGKATEVELTLDRPGTYTYFCDRHHFMRGTLT